MSDILSSVKFPDNYDESLDIVRLKARNSGRVQEWKDKLINQCESGEFDNKEVTICDLDGLHTFKNEPDKIIEFVNKICDE